MLDRTRQTWPPDYTAALALRQKNLSDIRSDPKLLFGALEYYKTRPAQFINDWCDTYDPRNAGSDLPTRLPFLLFDRQYDLVAFIHSCITVQTDGLIEKCREMGATWIGVGVSVWLWRFWEGAAVGWGSRDQDLVDRIGDPDSIFEKIRMMINWLPPEFMPRGFNPQKHMTFMRIVNPQNGATITGDCGDNIGRGGRKLVHFNDEAAHYLHPDMIEAALSETTRCKIDISSVNGIGNVFYRKRQTGIEWSYGKKALKGQTNVFVMDWRQHPAKSQAWYDERRAKAEREGLLANFAQEVDRDYAASVEGVIIRQEWVDAAIDAHVKLQLGDVGPWGAALDVADEGGDRNALSTRKGIVLKTMDETGAPDVGVTARRAIGICGELSGNVYLQYDCIGVGAGVKSEANRLIAEKVMPKRVHLVPWNAGAKVQDPRARVVDNDPESLTNEEFFTNFKAQAWWAAARRFELTWRAVNDPTFVTWDADDLISLDSRMPLLWKLKQELSQPTFSRGYRLKLLVDKKPNGTKSPNLADSLIMNYFPVKQYAPPTAQFGVYG